jgi:hypothetical protein
MNIELLNKIMDHIEEEPRRFNMEAWYEDVSEAVKMEAIGEDYDYIMEQANRNAQLFQDTNDIPPCGAVGCLAGTACILNGAVQPLDKGNVINGRLVLSYEYPAGGWFNAGRAALDLTIEQAKRLFFPRKGFGLIRDEAVGTDEGFFWPEPFASEYRDNSENPSARAEIVKRRIAHFIATDGRE